MNVPWSDWVINAIFSNISAISWQYLPPTRQFNICLLHDSSIFASYKTVQYLPPTKQYNIHLLQNSPIFTSYKTVQYLPPTREYNIYLLQNSTIFTSGNIGYTRHKMETNKPRKKTQHKKLKRWVTHPIKNWGELRCSQRVSNSCLL
jgi:hypothetical protein